jgi:NADPH:quinone reductase-like Zn-dependent oxidoreductase
MRLATGLTKPKQRVLGMQLTGLVEAVGADLRCFKVCDAVFGAASRTLMEFTCTGEDQLCRKPKRLISEQAAASASGPCNSHGTLALVSRRCAEP